MVVGWDAAVVVTGVSVRVQAAAKRAAAKRERRREGERGRRDMALRAEIFTTDDTDLTDKSQLTKDEQSSSRDMEIER